MQQTLAQTVNTRKRITNPVAFKLGIDDGKAGATWADGYSLFCGPTYTQWRMGWELGRKAARRRQVTH